MEYCVVRPGGLTNDPPGRATIVASQGDVASKGGRISRADVAAVCVEALTNPGARNVTLEIVSAPPSGQSPGPQQQQAISAYEQKLRSLWQGLAPDAS